MNNYSSIDILRSSISGIPPFAHTQKNYGQLRYNNLALNLHLIFDAIFLKMCRLDNPGNAS